MHSLLKLPAPLVLYTLCCVNIVQRCIYNRDGGVSLSLQERWVRAAPFRSEGSEMHPVVKPLKLGTLIFSAVINLLLHIVISLQF